MDVNAEPLTDVVADSLAERNDFMPSGTAKIHQHQGLLLVDAGTAHRATLPAALVNHPAGGNLLVLIIDMVVGHFGLLCQQLLELLAADDGIHEEAAGITRHLRVRQFLAADVDNRLA